MKYDIGIIGGAGPLAGRLFFDKIIAWYQNYLNAWEDKDFPLMFIISYPFSDMLFEGKKEAIVAGQLRSIIDQFTARYRIIACNTLHCFLDEGEDKDPCWMHLMKITAEFLSANRIEKAPLTLCTTTSREYRIHEKYFPCVFPSKKNQEKIDKIIEEILKGKQHSQTARELNEILHSEKKEEQHVILGCTELSLLYSEYPIDTTLIVDPCTLAIEKVCRLLNDIC